jgi:Na+-driven multidrug efflux pump
MLAIIRHIVLIIPAMLILNHIWGLNGFIWSQLVADSINAVTAFLIYTRVDGKIREQMNLMSSN